MVQINFVQRRESAGLVAEGFGDSSEPFTSSISADSPTAGTAKCERGCGTGKKRKKSSPLEVGGELCEACLHCG